MAWYTIQATDDLSVELWPAGNAANEPLLKVRSKAMEQGNELGVVVVYLEEVRHLIDALAEGAADLAAAEAGRSPYGPDDSDDSYDNDFPP